MRIVLMGAPGSGKGTQAKNLVDRYGCKHLSSGDVFRAEKASGSQLGRKLSQYMSAGALVPDEIVVEMMAQAIAAADGDTGLLLDGFPRTVAQAEALDATLAERNTPLDAVAVIETVDAALMRRIVGRRSCPDCGKVYHVDFMPPKQNGVCDACGGALTQRADDTDLVVKQRLEAYKAQTEPVIAYYRGRDGIRTVTVDGNQDVNAVTEAMVAALESLKDGS